MNLRRIDLEYCRAPSRFGRVLLGMGIVAVAMTAAAQLRLAEEADRWERAVALSAPRVEQAAADAQGDSSQEIEQANEVIRRLSLPWDALFRGMEAASMDRVALLGVEPDPRRGRVVLSGEAAGYGEILRYMTRLDAGGVLAQPLLLNHAVDNDTSGHPVAFSISARWNLAPEAQGNLVPGAQGKMAPAAFWEPASRMPARTSP